MPGRTTTGFWGHVNKTPTCWLYVGYCNSDGYGVYSPHSKVNVLAHRYVLGEIPEGMEVDHLCRVRNCVNPEHLEIVTHEENMHRAPFVIEQMNRTHCPQNHEYTVENTKYYNGKRVCHTCRLERNREYRKRKKELKTNA